MGGTPFSWSHMDESLFSKSNNGPTLSSLGISQNICFSDMMVRLNISGGSGNIVRDLSQDFLHIFGRKGRESCHNQAPIPRLLPRWQLMGTSMDNLICHRLRNIQS
ncbi:hypothetical protein BDDG_11752 [Blastomyces dermatitidis ATCC 18188]|uniref:Uncharacterized protein n=1 Tax=Ajellomyces dermatitidis (strain ATCC 18188 / CBS 674.68) TaxID=653446 RepID=A0A0J9HCS2_AJEDA|nr:hypothetical protein BDFG_02055 [Blastomyces dermatitidis ATCC 26199]KMW66854.1 hypothetical protein BDDG_11752 [Blastomyces dermatitidis ATCC 18188]